MNFIHQKQNECYLTVLAMLTGRPVSAIRRSILSGALAKESWSRLTCSGSTDKGKLLKFNVEKFLAKNLPWLSIDSFSMDQSVTAKSDRLDLLDFAGRGAATIRSLHGWRRHIVAFEANIIYDSALAAPISVSDWLLYLRSGNWAIENIYKQN